MTNSTAPNSGPTRCTIGALREAVTAIRRLPLTLTLLTIVITASIWSGALTSGTPRSTIERWGFDLQNLERGRLWVLFTADLLVFGRSHLASTILMFAIFCAPLEVLSGTRVLAAVFWPSSVGGTLATSLFVLWPGSDLGWNPIPDLITEPDVGASVAMWGIAGALAVSVSRYGRRWGWLLGAVCVLFLLNALRLNRGTADVAHLVGFAIGTGIGSLVGPSAHAREVDEASQSLTPSES